MLLLAVLVLDLAHQMLLLEQKLEDYEQPVMVLVIILLEAFVIRDKPLLIKQRNKLMLTLRV